MTVVGISFDLFLSQKNGIIPHKGDDIMKTIILFGGNEAIVDDEYYEKLSGYRYYENNKGYAYRNTNGTTVYMHREIINAPKGMLVDHINGNRLDNRKSNLRLATREQNQRNMRKTLRPCTSKYKGVAWIEPSKAWLATIRVNGKQLRIGNFTTEEAAAAAYNEKAREHFGEFAWLNDVPSDYDWEAQKIPNRKDGTGKSKYRGVSFITKSGKWQAHIMHNYKSIYLGCYEDEITAAEAYNKAAIKYKGDKAKLNVIPKEA